MSPQLDPSLLRLFLVSSTPPPTWTRGAGGPLPPLPLPGSPIFLLC